jgi:hypothetical protein
MLDWFGNFHYFLQPHRFSRILCAHNLILPA